MNIRFGFRNDEGFKWVNFCLYLYFY
jgi:hypothetical protein